MEKLKRLFEPIKLGPLEIKNRIAFAPTHMGYASDRGEVTDQILCHYVARARGGTGLIIVEGCGITGKYAFSVGRGLACNSDRQLPGLKELADTIHNCGAAAIVQIALGQGAQALYSHPRRDLVAPSPIPTRIKKGIVPKGLEIFDGIEGETPRALSVEEIKDLQRIFIEGAERIKRAGFDGIELHGAHGYLLAEFLSPYSNHRNDDYGGSLEKRLNLPIELIKGVREKVGKDFFIGYRLSGDEHIEGGLTLQDTCEIVPHLERAGLDFIHLSSGRYEAMNYTFPSKEGVMLAEAKAIKEKVRIPVICPNIHDPVTGEKAIEEGCTDMVSLSRALIADPSWANKAREGRFNEINRCIFCGNCLSMIFRGFAATCTVNPDVGRERFISEYFPPPHKTGKMRH